MADTTSASSARLPLVSQTSSITDSDQGDVSGSTAIDNCQQVTANQSSLPSKPPCSQSQTDNDPKEVNSSDDASSGRCTNSPLNQFSDTDSSSNHNSNHNHPIGNGTSDEFRTKSIGPGRRSKGSNVAPKLAPQMKNAPSSKPRKPHGRTDIQFRVGEKLEACDSTGTWYPAKIVALNENEQSVLIHFIRWSTRFDQWMQMESDHLRPLPKPSDDNSSSNSDGSHRFQVGDNVLAIWTDNKKYPGRIQSVLSDGNYNILFYDGYRKKVRKNLVESLPADFPLETSEPIELKKMNSLPNSRKSSLETPLEVTLPVDVKVTSTPITPQSQSGKTSRKKTTNTTTPLSSTVASKEFVVEADHNQFKCTINNCNKSFRKENLLSSHIKHYHPEHAPPAPVVVPTKPEIKETSTPRRRPATSKQSTVEEKDFDRMSDKSDKPADQNNGVSRSSSKNSKTKDVGNECSNDTLFEPPKETETSEPKSPELSSRFSTDSNQNCSSTNGSTKKKRRSAAASRPVKNQHEHAFDSQHSSPKVNEVHEWSDSTIEESLAGSESKLQARKKRPSQRRSNVNRTSSAQKLIDEDSTLFDLDDECFESADESRTNSPKKKKRYRRNDDINKQILNMKIDLQDRRDRHPGEFQDEPFLSNTPSTSSASESALAESADFADYHAYDDKRFNDYSPSHELGELRAKKKKLIKPVVSGKRSKPDYSNASSPLLSTPLSTVLWAPFRRHVGLRNTESSTSAELCTSVMSPLATASAAPIERTASANHELPFWDARIVKDIHESDEVDELVHCICDYKEESGLMIQCEVCLTWQHGTCFEIEDEQQVPECYVCFACRDPRLGRESQRYTYDQELMSKGKFPILLPKKQYMTDDTKRGQTGSSQKQMCSINQLLGIVVEISLILKSLRYKLNLIKENRIEEMQEWYDHVPRTESDVIDNSNVVPIPTSTVAAEEMKNKIKTIEDVPNGDSEMIGDILNFSKNLLENDPCSNNLKSEDGIVEEELLKSNDDLDDATDLIDFITSAGKDSDKDLPLQNEDIKKDFMPMDDFKSEPIDEKTLGFGTNEPKHSIDSRSVDVMKKPNRPISELMLDHIVSVQNDLLFKLTLIEKKILELELEMGIDKSSERDLQEDLLLFKDTIKGVYRDLHLVKELTDRHSFMSNHL